MSSPPSLSSSSCHSGPSLNILFVWLIKTADSKDVVVDIAPGSDRFCFPLCSRENSLKPYVSGVGQVEGGGRVEGGGLFPILFLFLLRLGIVFTNLPALTSRLFSRFLLEGLSPDLL